MCLGLIRVCSGSAVGVCFTHFNRLKADLLYIPNEHLQTFGNFFSILCRFCVCSWSAWGLHVPGQCQVHHNRPRAEPERTKKQTRGLIVFVFNTLVLIGTVLHIQKIDKNLSAYKTKYYLIFIQKHLKIFEEVVFTM